MADFDAVIAPPTRERPAELMPTMGVSEAQATPLSAFAPHPESVQTQMQAGPNVPQAPVFEPALTFSPLASSFCFWLRP